MKTARYLNEIYSWNYGSEAVALIGQQWEADTKTAEAERYVRECLMQYPYITAVKDTKAVFDDGQLTVSAKIITPYGSQSLEVTI